MDSASSWEYKTLVSELTQGMEQAKQLRFQLNSTSSHETQDLLVRKILSSYEKALIILHWNGPEGQAQIAIGAPQSSVTIEQSPRSEEVNKTFEDHKENNTPKKRKMQATWTEQVRVNPENVLEGPKEDGFSWRKYGQKDILGAKFPRSYYRCTYRHVQSCVATKQVQRSDNDQLVFEITYKGTHTCRNANPPPQKQERNDCNNIFLNHQQQHNQTLLDLKANLRVHTEDLSNQEDTLLPVSAYFSFPSTYACNDDRENYHLLNSSIVDDENKLDTFSSFFYSPDTSESDYFSAATYQMQNCGKDFQHSGSEMAETMSAHASATNSPRESLDFSVDTANVDPNFPFSNRGFF